MKFEANKEFMENLFYSCQLGAEIYKLTINQRQNYWE